MLHATWNKNSPPATKRQIKRKSQTSTIREVGDEIVTAKIRGWLQHRLNLTDQGAANLCDMERSVARPMIIDDDREATILLRINQLENRINWLQARLNMTDKEISKVLAMHGKLLGLTTENLSKKCDWIQTTLDLDDEQ